jgi:hypothetical protein
MTLAGTGEGTVPVARWTARHTRRTLVRTGAGALALAGVAGLGACGPAGGGAGDGAAGAGGAQSKGPITLRVNYRTEKYFPVRAQQFTEANPNVKIDMVADSGYEKLVALLAAGDPGGHHLGQHRNRDLLRDGRAGALPAARLRRGQG